MVHTQWLLNLSMVFIACLSSSITVQNVCICVRWLLKVTHSWPWWILFCWKKWTSPLEDVALSNGFILITVEWLFLASLCHGWLKRLLRKLPLRLIVISKNDRVALMNRTLLNHSRAVCLTAGVPDSFWSFAISWAAYDFNIPPSWVLDNYTSFWH